MASKTKKVRTEFVCSDCGGTTAKWAGQCPHCKAWNTLQEFTVKEGVAARYGSVNERRGGFVDTTGSLQDLSEVSTAEAPRIQTGLSEFDRVMGGGLVQGGVALIGGDPGIGKSTLLLQVMARLVAAGIRAVYVSGEESATQIALRAQRLQIDPHGLQLMSEIELEHIEAVLKDKKPEFVVVDSIQTLFSGQLESAPGSVSQVRECAARLTRLAKTLGTTLIFVGHVTKDGALAGPRILEHIVDTVLYFEGDTHSNFRLVRAFKNRFGAVNELGVFAMTDHGLRGVTNPSAIFLSEYKANVPGATVLVTQEGTRPLLVEIQALVDQTHLPTPRRRAASLDASCGPPPARGRRMLRSGRLHQRGRGREDHRDRGRPGGARRDRLEHPEQTASRRPRRLRRSGLGGRNPPGAPRSGASARSGEAGLLARDHPARERAPRAH